MGIVADVAEVVRYRDLIKQFVVRDLKLKYERSALGFVWSLLNPLLMIGVYTFVFSIVLRSDVKNYPIFLVPVLLPWNFLLRCMQGVAQQVYQSGYLLNRAVFPPESLLFGGMLSAFVDFTLEMMVFVVILVIIGSPLLPGLLVIPLVMIIYLLFVTGIVMFLAVGYVYYQDMQYIVPILCTAWFFLTPVFYPVTAVPQRYQSFYMLNPVVHMAACFRQPLYTGSIPSGTELALVGFIACTVFMLGWSFFAGYKRSFAEVV
jgi:ABC-type polysaccharide/polyol phosphate export permease